jgi:hypothetical protein
MHSDKTLEKGYLVKVTHLNRQNFILIVYIDVPTDTFLSQVLIEPFMCGKAAKTQG